MVGYEVKILNLIFDKKGGKMILIINAVFWFVLALIFAAIEIESHERSLWAEKMPTWYRSTGFLGTFHGLIMSGKPLTGYHIFMYLMTIMIFHAGFVLGTEWSIKAELMAWSIYFAWCPLWDYLWFVLNPYYGFRNFKRDRVWCHTKSYWLFGLLPSDYIKGWALSIFLAYGASWFSNEPSVFVNHLGLLGLFLFFTFITIVVIAPPYQRWYKKMRLQDDRDKVEIFYHFD